MGRNEGGARRDMQVFVIERHVGRVAHLFDDRTGDRAAPRFTAPGVGVVNKPRWRSWCIGRRTEREAIETSGTCCGKAGRYSLAIVTPSGLTSAGAAGAELKTVCNRAPGTRDHAGEHDQEAAARRLVAGNRHWKDCRALSVRYHPPGSPRRRWDCRFRSSRRCHGLHPTNCPSHSCGCWMP